MNTPLLGWLWTQTVYRHRFCFWYHYVKHVWIMMSEKDKLSEKLMKLCDRFCSLGELWNVYAISEKIYVDLIGSNQNVTQSNYSLTIYNKTQLQQKSINGITIHNLDTKHQCLRIWVLSFFMCLITLSLPLLPPIHTVKTRLLFYVENINGKNCIFVCCSIKRLRFCVWVFAELLQAHFPSSTQEVICGT